MTDKFKIGDRVVIREDSKWFGDDVNYNPTNLIGEVVHVRELTNVGEFECQFKYEVLWDNNHTNGYTEIDLKLVEEVK